MNLNLDNILPIGTIVKIRTSLRPMMIMVYFYLNETEVYDYIGCLYPFGVFNIRHSYLFDTDDIKEVIAKGYSKEFDEKYKKNLIDGINQAKETIKNSNIEVS